MKLSIFSIVLGTLSLLNMQPALASSYHPDEESVIAILPKTVLIKEIENGKCPKNITTCTVSTITAQDLLSISMEDAEAFKLSKIGDSKRAYLCLENNNVVWLQTFVPGIAVDGETFVGRRYANRPEWIPDTLPGFLTQYKSCADAMVDASSGKLR